MIRGVLTRRPGSPGAEKRDQRCGDVGGLFVRDIVTATVDRAAGYVGRELAQHRYHPRAETVISAQGQNGYAERLLLVFERRRMIGGERSIPLHAAACPPRE